MNDPTGNALPRLEVSAVLAGECIRFEFFSCLPGEVGPTRRASEITPYKEAVIAAHCAKIFENLSLGAKERGRVDLLQGCGLELYRLLLPPQLRNFLGTPRKLQPLLFNLDEKLLHLPWELLFDGQQF